MSARPYRYHLPQRAVKGDCPQCSPSHRRTLSRFVDSLTGELLPEQYGRCDRESNCGYFLSPYHSEGIGHSYASMQRTGNHKSPMPMVIEQWNAQPIPSSIYSIPDEVFKRTLNRYDQNQFAYLLRKHFGNEKADTLLQRFQIGTSAYWPGASVFWIIDSEGRARGGQVNLFADDWHRAKFTDGEGNSRACISSVSHCLLNQLKRNRINAPDWLTDYHEYAPKWPAPFGLHQLRGEPADKPIAIVEACKTAVVCAGYFTEFVWMAIGGKSYLNAERLADLRNRKIVLFPDLNAYDDWTNRANAMKADGFDINVSSLLENNATDEQRQQGLDLADFLLQPVDTQRPMIVTSLSEWAAKPGSILRPDESQLTRL